MTMTTDDIKRRIDRDVYDAPLAAILKHLVEMIEGHTARLDDLAVRDADVRGAVTALTDRLEALEQRHNVHTETYDHWVVDIGERLEALESHHAAPAPARDAGRIAGIIRKYVSNGFREEVARRAWETDVDNAAREIASLPAPARDAGEVVEAARGLLKFPSHGKGGGPLVQAVVLYEDGSSASIPAEAFYRAHAALAAYDAAPAQPAPDAEAIRAQALEEAAAGIDLSAYEANSLGRAVGSAAEACVFFERESAFKDAARRVRTLRTRPAPEPVGEEEITAIAAKHIRVGIGIDGWEIRGVDSFINALVERFTITHKEG